MSGAVGHTAGLTPRQIALLRDMRMDGAIDALLFSPFRLEGPGLRAAGLIGGIGDSTGITAKGFAALVSADAKLADAIARATGAAS